jgi:hypothetical protein
MQALERGSPPVVFFLPKAEVAKAACPNAPAKALPKSLNPEWEICHIDNVAGRPFRGDIVDAPIENLRERMLLLISPANMFLVHGKLGWGNARGYTTGCGDRSEFAAAFKDARRERAIRVG